MHCTIIFKYLLTTAINRWIYVKRKSPWNLQKINKYSMTETLRQALSQKKFSIYCTHAKNTSNEYVRDHGSSLNSWSKKRKKNLRTIAWYILISWMQGRHTYLPTNICEKLRRFYITSGNTSKLSILFLVETFHEILLWWKYDFM